MTSHLISAVLSVKRPMKPGGWWRPCGIRRSDLEQRPESWERAGVWIPGKECVTCDETSQTFPSLSHCSRAEYVTQAKPVRRGFMWSQREGPCLLGYGEAAKALPLSIEEKPTWSQNEADKSASWMQSQRPGPSWADSKWPLRSPFRKAFIFICGDVLGCG